MVQSANNQPGKKQSDEKQLSIIVSDDADSRQPDDIPYMAKGNKEYHSEKAFLFLLILQGLFGSGSLWIMNYMLIHNCVDHYMITLLISIIGFNTQFLINKSPKNK